MSEIDVRVFVRPDRQEKVHIYQRSSGLFGSRSFVWVKDEWYEGWTVGNEWGHFYDSEETAISETASRFTWVSEQ